MYLELLGEFEYTTQHLVGREHGNADRLSQQPCDTCDQCDRIERRDGDPTHTQL